MKVNCVKKCISIATLGLLVTVVSTPTFAMSSTNDNSIVLLEETLNVWDDSDSIEITREQYVESYALNNNITIEEADKLLAEQTAIALSKLPDHVNRDDAERNIGWRQKTFDFTFNANSNYRATLVVDYEFYHHGSFRQINSVHASSRFLTGIHNGSWNQLSAAANAVNHNNTPGSFPTQNLSLMASGYFESSISNTGTGSMSIPGFTVSSSTNRVTYFRSFTFQMSERYTLR